MHVITTMHLCKAFTENMRWDRVVMTLPTPVELSFHHCGSVTSITNEHGGLPIKTFGLALRNSLLHLSRRGQVSRFQTVSRSAAAPELR